MEGKLNVLEIHRMAVHNGPGIRTTVHLKGCPLRCIWCSTPESQLCTPQLGYEPKRCIGCGNCIKSCPTAAIYRGHQGSAVLNRRNCTECLACTEVCSSGSLSGLGTYRTAEELYKEIIKDKVFFQMSGGGVTLSGGEPMMHVNDQLIALLQMLTEAHIGTGVDTCGYAGRSDFDAVIPFTDFFLWDLKQMDTQKHRDYTGVGNERIIDNLRYAAKAGKPIYIRWPLIPGYTDDKENLERICDLAGGIDTVQEIQIMPVHQLGASRYACLGMTNPIEGVETIDKETLHEKKRHIEERGFTARILG